jgi:NAD(P)-dependent dehydrogenase (short-subunit alcohol dehydrogenase family)
MTTATQAMPGVSRKRFEGKVAVVTGGNSGIGLATAKAYAQEGAQVAITGRDEKTLRQAAKEIGEGTLAIRADAAKTSELDTAMAAIKNQFGRIDALFVNAGVGRFVPFEQVTEAFYDEIMNINVKGLFFTIQKALPLMTKGSAIVLNASVNGHIALPGSTVYGASKAAVINLAKTLSIDLLSKGIRVNVVSPGPVMTPIFDRMGLPAEQLKQTQDWITNMVPLKRFGTSEELASAVLYLSSPESSFVIGSELVVDGGVTLS